MEQAFVKDVRKPKFLHRIDLEESKIEINRSNTYIDIDLCDYARDYLTWVPSDVNEEVKTVLVTFNDYERGECEEDEDRKNDDQYRVFDLETGKVRSIFRCGYTA